MCAEPQQRPHRRIPDHEQDEEHRHGGQQPPAGPFDQREQRAEPGAEHRGGQMQPQDPDVEQRRMGMAALADQRGRQGRQRQHHRERDQPQVGGQVRPGAAARVRGERTGELPAVYPVRQHAQPGQHRDEGDRGDRRGLQRGPSVTRVDDAQHDQEQHHGRQEPLGGGEQAGDLGG
jgi:hypothetical protein